MRKVHVKASSSRGGSDVSGLTLFNSSSQVCTEAYLEEDQCQPYIENSRSAIEQNKQK